MTHLLVIGGVSLDTVHTPERAVTSAGGAGIYTCMAAICCGAEVTLVAPHPLSMPPQLADAERCLKAWLGPAISESQLPRFEIRYVDGSADYFSAFQGAECDLTSAHLPSNMESFDWVHVTPLGAPERQREFILACRQNGAKRISAGTYPCVTGEHPQQVRENADLTDVFFMNEEEARVVYGSLDQIKVKHDQTLYITLGEKGALVLESTRQTSLPTQKVVAVDPTGAGDTFCGAALAQLMQGASPVEAAQNAMGLAARVIQDFGPLVPLWN